MAYAKSFQAIITIYPDFEKDSYCNYFKEQLANWITDCFNSYIDFFNIKVTQAKGNAILYIFDAESGTSQARFAITFKAPETTSIDGIIPSGDNANVRVVNTAGITVYEGNIADFKSTANAGVYLVIDSGRTYKIIIK